jgi:hypothetical protein
LHANRFKAHCSSEIAFSLKKIVMHTAISFLLIYFFNYASTSGKSAPTLFPLDYEVLNTECNNDREFGGTFRLLKDCQNADGEDVKFVGYITSVGPVVCCFQSQSRSLESKSIDYCSKFVPKSSILFKISGGERSEVAEFPHMVALGYENLGETLFDCGGSLISEKFIITVAHCVNRKGRAPTIVRMGRVSEFHSCCNILCQVTLFNRHL